MPLHLAVNIFIIHTLQIVRKPFIIDSKKAEECRLSCALTTHKADHDFKLTARFVNTMNCRQHQKPYDFSCIFIIICAKKTWEQTCNPAFPIPLQGFKKIPDWVITSLTGCNTDSLIDDFIIGNAIMCFYVTLNLVHIHISDTVSVPLPQ